MANPRIAAPLDKDIERRRKIATARAANASQIQLKFADTPVLVEAAVHADNDTKRRIACGILANRPEGVANMRTVMRSRWDIDITCDQDGKHRTSIEENVTKNLYDQLVLLRLRESELMTIASYGKQEIAKNAIDELANCNSETAFYELFIISKKAKTKEAREYAAQKLNQMQGIAKQLAEEFIGLIVTGIITLDILSDQEPRKPDIEARMRRIIGFFRKYAREKCSDLFETDLTYLPFANALLEIGAHKMHVMVVLDKILYKDNMERVVKEYMEASEDLASWLERNYPYLLILINEWKKASLEIISNDQYANLRKLIPSNLLEAQTTETIFAALCPDAVKDQVLKMLEPHKGILGSDLLNDGEKLDGTGIDPGILRYALNLGLLATKRPDGPPGMPDILPTIPLFEKLTDNPDRISQLLAARMITAAYRRFQLDARKAIREIEIIGRHSDEIEEEIRKEEGKEKEK